MSAVLTLRWQGSLSEARVTQGSADLTLSAITPLALPSRRLTHWWSCQRLSPHNLGWSQPIQEIAELAFRPKPGGGEDEPGEGGRGACEGIWLVGMQRLCLPGTGHSPLASVSPLHSVVYYFGWGQTV